jgi:subtilisin family serine protease
MGRWLRSVALATMFVGSLAAPAPAATKLDHAARVALHQLRAGAGAASLRAEGIGAATLDGELDVFIVGNVSRAELEAAGARVRTALPGIFTAFVPVAAIDAVEAIAGVEKIEGAQICEVEHDLSVPTTGADLFRGPGPGFTGLNGAGVIIGGIDTGVDYDHEDFKDALGNTRFLKIWDQTDAIGPPAAGFGYGSDWTAADINSLVSRAKDTHGHGSHTMGTQGGDGSTAPGGVAAPAFTYTGMAPMADLIGVDASTTGSFSNTGMLDGINYIFQQATAFGKPAVANLSIGGTFGPHDGSSTFEVAVDALTGPGRQVVFSAGNNRADPHHAETFATVGGADITMTCGAGTTLNRRFVINGWYNATETLNVTVITPGGTVIGPIALGTNNAAYPGTVTANGTVYVENGITTSTNGSRQIILDVLNQGGGANLSGTWTYRFHALALGAANGEVDLWRHFQSVSAVAANFAMGFEQAEYINGIGTGMNTIAVAAWQSRFSWTDCRQPMWNSPPGTSFSGSNPAGSICSFSSMGPTRDGRSKPEIAAPGSAIGSVLTQDAGALSCPATATTFLHGLRHWMNQGTSMAAPHVTGAIALFMQKYGSVTPAQIKTLLQTRAVVDGNTGAVWNQDWGYGKLHLGDMTDPASTVVYPNGAEVVEVGDMENLTWTATDPYLGVTGVDIELSRNGVGGPWETIALNEPNDGSYTWTVTGPVTGNAVLRVTAKDAAGNQGDDLSDAEWEIVSVTAVATGEPVAEFSLRGALPNPLGGGEARFEYAVPRATEVSLALFDLHGREVAVLAGGPHAAGRHQATWSGEVDGRPAPSGVYFLRMRAAGISLTRRIVVAR